MADWAILVVTLVRRRQFYARLMRRLAPQLSSRVAVYTLEDQGAERIGEKRQRMIESIREPVCNFIDDDDLVAPNYCARILAAIDADDPDVVGFRLRYFEDGVQRGTSIHSVTAGQWSTEVKNGREVHYRTPNHLNPVRREMALAAGFPPLDSGEDAEYSRRLFKLYPKMRESFIDEFLYSYYYRTPRNRREAATLPVPDPA